MNNSTETAKKRFIAGITLAVCGLLISFCGCEGKTAVSNIRPSETSDVLEAQASRILKEALASKNPRARANAIEAVATIPVNRGRVFMQEAAQLLTDDFVPVRFAAAVAVGDTRYAPAKNTVKQLLQDENHNAQLAAVSALRKVEPRTSIERLEGAIKNPDLQVRANAAFLLGKMGNKRALTLLYEAITDESSDDKVRLNSIEAIARLGDERIYQKIWALLISAYADDRILGVQAMGALGSAQAKDALMTMLTDDVIEIRIVAAGELGKLGDTAGEKAVEEALTQGIAATAEAEGRERINMLGALAIGQIKTPALKKFLPELLKNESPFVKIAAAKAVFQSISNDNTGR